MKLIFLTYGCDQADCAQESPHQPTWRQARREAKKAHWQFHRAVGAEWHYCPKHRTDR
jgi:hypothetical protein